MDALTDPPSVVFPPSFVSLQPATQKAVQRDMTIKILQPTSQSLMRQLWLASATFASLTRVVVGTDSSEHGRHVLAQHKYCQSSSHSSNFLLPLLKRTNRCIVHGLDGRLPGNLSSYTPSRCWRSRNGILPRFRLRNTIS